MTELHAKDIRDECMLAIVAAINAQTSTWPGSKTHRWAFTMDLDEAFWPFPPKVILAKARALVKRDLLDGCGCGCRGDFEITAKGREVLANG